MEKQLELQQASLQITGMTCAACANRIEKGLKKLEGVADANVNFALEKASVTYNPSQISVSAMEEKILVINGIMGGEDMQMIKFAVTPGFQTGGTIFKPEQLAVLGSIVGEDAKIELTTFKQLYVEMQVEEFNQVKEKLSGIGLQIYPTGFVTKSLITCNFCRGAEDAGLEMAEALNNAISGIETPTPIKIGFAGCALGTSEPLLKDIGVVKMRDKFDIYVGGEPKSLKPTFAVLLVPDVQSDSLIPMVQKLIHHFQQHGKIKEKFLKFINRVTIEALREAIAK